jgi:outer membrane protein TolC
VLESQIELAKVKTALISAQVAYNLSQIQLLYEMGLLNEDVLSRPLAIPSNAL